MRPVDRSNDSGKAIVTVERIHDNGYVISYRPLNLRPEFYVYGSDNVSEHFTDNADTNGKTFGALD